MPRDFILKDVTEYLGEHGSKSTVISNMHLYISLVEVAYGQF
jgi:hypothetical protein